MTSSLRLLIISDVGGAETRHIGDEAMLEANLENFRRLIPQVSFTVVSRDPVWTAARYGVDAVAPFGFPADLSANLERAAMLNLVLSQATSRSPGHATIDAVVGADAVVLSGGGNLSSTWPSLLYERAALLHLARIFARPAIVLGQTIGPRLGREERRLLGETLSSARFVGLRELPSAELAAELGVPVERLWYQCDDAMILDGVLGSVQPLDRPGESSIAVTIDSEVRAAGDEVFGALVSQLRKVSEATGASLVLIPHVFGNESAGFPSDLTEASVLADQLGLPRTVIAAGLDAAEARQVTSNASLVISSRYHPIIFGLAAGIPAVGIYGDEYCRIKLQGALAHARLEDCTLTYQDITHEKLLPRALQIWRSRAEARLQIESRRNAWHKESRERWAFILRALDPTDTIATPASNTMFGRPMEDIAPVLASAREERRQWGRLEKAASERSASIRDEVLRRTSSSESEVGVKKAVSRRWSALRSKFQRGR